MNKPQLDTIDAMAQRQASRIQEEIWVLQAQQGNEQALERLVDRFDRGLLSTGTPSRIWFGSI